MNKQASVVIIIRDSNSPGFPGSHREVLCVTNRNFSTLTLPGGTNEPEELPSTTAIRELQEEIGVSITPTALQHVGGGLSQLEGEPPWGVFIYYAASVWGVPMHVENGTEIHWRTWESFLNETIFADFYRKHLPNGIEPFPTTVFLGAS